MLGRHTLREKYYSACKVIFLFLPTTAWEVANFGVIYLKKYLLEHTGHFDAEIKPTVHVAEKIVWLTENYLFCYGLSNLAPRPIFCQLCG